MGGSGRAGATGPVPLGRVRPGGDPAGSRRGEARPRLRAEPVRPGEDLVPRAGAAGRGPRRPRRPRPGLEAVRARPRQRQSRRSTRWTVGQQRAEDPFAELGTSLRDEKATALVVSDGERRIASLTNIGTFDRDLVLRLLLGALARAGGPPPAGDAWSMLDAGRPADARRALRPNGEAARGSTGSPGPHRCWATTTPRSATPCRWPRSDGPFRDEAEAEAGRALLRLGRPGGGGDAPPRGRPRAGPARPRPTTSAAPCSGPGSRSGPARRGGTRPPGSRGPRRPSEPGPPGLARGPRHVREPDRPRPRAGPVAGRGHAPRSTARRDEDRAVRTAVDYLLASQDRDGTWSSASQAGKYRVAITALAARSLYLWGTRLDGDRGARARGRPSGRPSG